MRWSTRIRVTAVAAVLGAAALVTGTGTASASVAGAQEWKTRCEYGRACICHTAEQVWNADRCDSRPVNDDYVRGDSG